MIKNLISVLYRIRKVDSTLLIFVELLVNQLFDGPDGSFRLLPSGLDLDLAALGRSQRQNAHDAPAISNLSVFRKTHLRVKLVYGLDQQGRRSSVEAELVFDLQLLNNFSH